MQTAGEDTEHTVPASSSTMAQEADAHGAAAAAAAATALGQLAAALASQAPFLRTPCSAQLLLVKPNQQDCQHQQCQQSWLPVLSCQQLEPVLVLQGTLSPHLSSHSCIHHVWAQLNSRKLLPRQACGPARDPSRCSRHNTRQMQSYIPVQLQVRPRLASVGNHQVHGCRMALGPAWAPGGCQAAAVLQAIAAGLAH